MIRSICGVLVVLMVGHRASAQNDSVSITDPYALSIEEDILNLKVQSTKSYESRGASRRNESLHEALTSTYIITAEEIKQSGALTLGEVLRLAPGVLVRQKTNGYFSVSLRGRSGTVGDQSVTTENASVLLTIDGIPVNHWWEGGILWEALPVGLHDIRQVEIINTPNTAFFGPNAASGMINIVTKGVEEKNLHANISLQGSANQDYVHRGNAHFGISDRLRFRVSGHYQRLARTQDEFYLLDEQKYVPGDSLLYYQSTARETNVSAEKALRNGNINARAIYQPTDKVSVAATVGVKESYLQSIVGPLDKIALTNRNSKTSTVALRARLGNFRTHLAHQSGHYDMAVGYEGFRIRAENLYASAEYDYAKGVYQVKLGGDVNYNVFENKQPRLGIPVVTEPHLPRVLLGTNQFYHTGAFVSQDLRLIDGAWRLTAVARGDYLDLTGRLYPSYRLGTTYQLGKAHVVRANASSGWGNVSAQNYLSYDVSTLDYQTSRSLKPLEQQTLELGYRVEPYNELSLGATYFRSKTRNFIDFATATPNERANSDLVASQHGITADVRWSLNKLRTTAFVTLQRSKNTIGTEESTDLFVPRYFGGLTGNYRTFLNKLRFNAGVYFYGQSTLVAPEQNYVLPSKLIAHCKVSYNVWDEHALFFNARNVFNNKKIESPFADQTKSLYTVGIDLAF